MRAAAFALLLLAPAIGNTARAQGADPDAKLAELRDSIRALIEERTTLRTELTTAGLVDPTMITSADLKPLDDRVFVRYTMNKIARARITVQSNDKSITQMLTTDDYKDQHIVQIDGLVPNKQYNVTIEALRNTNPNIVAVTRQGRDQGSTFDRHLRFSTNALASPPQITSAGPVVTHSSIALPIASNQPVLFRATLRKEVGGRPSADAVTVGADFSRDEFGGGPRTGTLGMTTTLPFNGLEPASAYYYEVEALNQSGKTGAITSTRVMTASTPTPFGFEGPLNIHFDVARGLVVKWKSSAPAASGELIATFSNTTSHTRPAAVTDGGTAMEAELSTVDLLKTNSTPGTAPVISVRMKNQAGEAREMRVTVAVTMPKKADIASLGITSEQKKGLERTLEAMTDPGDDKNLRWQDIASTVLKLIPVVF